MNESIRKNRFIPSFSLWFYVSLFRINNVCIVWMNMEMFCFCNTIFSNKCWMESYVLLLLFLLLLNEINSHTLARLSLLHFSSPTSFNSHCCVFPKKRICREFHPNNTQEDREVKQAEQVSFYSSQKKKILHLFCYCNQFSRIMGYTFNSKQLLWKFYNFFFHSFHPENTVFFS
jgi:hypothetical protein